MHWVVAPLELHQYDSFFENLGIVFVVELSSVDLIRCLGPPVVLDNGRDFTIAS